MASYAGTRAKERHKARIAVKKSKQAGTPISRSSAMKEANKKAKSKSGGRSASADRRISNQQKSPERRTVSTIASYAKKFSDRTTSGLQGTLGSVSNWARRTEAPEVGLQSVGETMVSAAKGVRQTILDRYQKNQQMPLGQRIWGGVKKAALGPVLGSETGQNILRKGPAYPAVTGAYEAAKQRNVAPLVSGLKESGQRAKTMFEEQAFTGDKIAGVKEINPWFVAGFTEPLSKTGPLGKIIPKKSPLHAEARKYKSADEFAKNQPVFYHGSPTPLKSFSNKKGGVFFTDSMEDASGFAGSPDNVYEGYVHFKKPLVIDAKGAKWNELNTKYGTSTQEIISKAQKDGYDGVTFKNIVDNQMDTAGVGGESTIHYAYKPKDAFLNEDQLKELYNKSPKSQPLQEGGVKTTTPKSGIPKDAGEKLEAFMKAKPTESGLGKKLPSSGLPTEAAPKQTAKVLQESQKDISYLERIAKTKKGQVNPFINTKNLDISDEGKKFIDQTIEEAKPQLEESLGKTLTNKEAVEFADKTSQVLNRTIGKEQTKQFEAALLNTRRKLATMAESGSVDKEYIETLKTVKTFGTDIARKLQSFSIEAGTTSVTKQKILEAVLKVNDNTDDILKAAKGVDFTNANEAVNFYRKFIKPTAGEWIDVLRYNSMLSSPTTHIINTVSNLVNTAVVSPLEKGLTGTIDFLGGAVGKKREAFVGEALSYYKGAGKNIGEAAERFWGALTGKRAMTNLDLKFIPPASKGVKGGITKVLSVPTRFLEASDQFFTALAEGGERAALNLRQSKGVKVPLLEMKVKEKAAYRVFRQDLFSKEQGSVLDAVDQLTSKIMGLRSNPNPIVSTIAKFTVPFVKTPMNIFKQGLEYSPAGLSTIPGAANKAEQLSKAIIGSTVFAGAATMLASGRLTWGEPTSEKQRQEWRQAGIQPYSVKVGDKWYSYQKLSPGVAFPMAMVAAIDDMQKKKKLDDSTTEMILSSIAKYGEFLADQSYVKSIGDLLSAAKGGEAGIARVVGNYPQQMIPLRAFGGWLARLTDPEQRKIDNKAGFIDKQIQLLMMNIPGLSKNVPARLDVEGNPIPNRDRGINAISPVRVSTEDDRFMEYHLEAEKKRQTQREHQQLLDKAKEEVLKSGKSQKIGDTTVYLEDGEIKTTQGKYTAEAKEKYKEFKGLSDEEFFKKMDELDKAGQDGLVDAMREYRANDTTREMGFDTVDDWSNMSIGDRGRKVEEKMQNLSPDDRANLLSDMIRRDVVSDPLISDIVKRKLITADKMMGQDVGGGTKARVLYEEIKQKTGNFFEGDPDRETKLNDIQGMMQDMVVSGLRGMDMSPREKESQMDTVKTEFKNYLTDDKARKEGLTNEEERWSKLEVNDRAKLLVDKVWGKSKEEATDFLNNLGEKKLITDSVREEFKYQWKQRVEENKDQIIQEETDKQALYDEAAGLIQRKIDGETLTPEEEQRVEMAMSSSPTNLEGVDEATQPAFATTASFEPAGGMRTDRHNNPTAFTTDVAKSAGWVEGVDYEVGDPFPNNPNLRTAKIIGDPVDKTIELIDKIGFQTQSGKPRWSYINMSKDEWGGLAKEEKIAVIAKMYATEGGNGNLMNSPSQQYALTPSQAEIVQAVGTGQMTLNEAVDTALTEATTPTSTTIATAEPDLTTIPTESRTSQWLAQQNYPQWQSAFNIYYVMGMLQSMYKQRTQPEEYAGMPDLI